MEFYHSYPSYSHISFREDLRLLPGKVTPKVAFLNQMTGKQPGKGRVPHQFNPALAPGNNRGSTRGPRPPRH